MGPYQEVSLTDIIQLFTEMIFNFHMDLFHISLGYTAADSEVHDARCSFTFGFQPI